MVYQVDAASVRINGIEYAVPGKVSELLSRVSRERDYLRLVLHQILSDDASQAVN